VAVAVRVPGVLGAAPQLGVVVVVGGEFVGGVVPDEDELDEDEPDEGEAAVDPSADDPPQPARSVRPTKHTTNTEHGWRTTRIL